jgi:hypothetical protein
VVVRAEGGFALSDLAGLESVGPCFFELHLASDPSLFSGALKRLRPASIVWETGAVVPAMSSLVRLGALSQPVLAVDEEAAAGAAATLLRLGSDTVSLLVRAKNGELSPSTWRALEDPARTFRVTVVAVDGLSTMAARRLRGLTRASVEISLERAGPHEEALRAARFLSRAVDPPNERTVSEEEADAPLLHPALLR